MSKQKGNINLEEESTQGVNKELEALYEASFKNLKEGAIVRAKIIYVAGNNILLDLNYKAEGVLSRDEFLDHEDIKVGNEIDTFIVSLENEEGLVVLSKRKADKILGWEKINNEYKEGDTVTGKVVKRVKGGLMVNIGVEAFLPGSLVDIKGTPNLDVFIGKTIECVIVSINIKRKNVVVSRKDCLMKQMGAKKEEFLNAIQVDDIVSGIVKNITDYGAFIEIDVVDGLLHISDMSWGRINHPSELLAVGDKVKVKVLEVDKENQRVSLGMKQLSPDPWAGIKDKYPSGGSVKGKITNILPYGAFMELEPGIEGFIHVSDLSWTKKVRDAHEMFVIGDIIEAAMLSVDSEKRKLSLGIKQLEQDPWKDIESKYILDSKVNARIVGFNEDGAFVEIEDGIDGFIYKNDISWTRRINHAYEVLKKGQKMEFQIIGINKALRQLLLGLKQLRPDPWPQIEEKYKSGTLVDGQVTSIFPFGVFVQLEEDLEGLLHISEIEKKNAKIQEKFAPGDSMQVSVLSIDNDKKQIRLTRKGLETEDSEIDESKDAGIHLDAEGDISNPEAEIQNSESEGSIDEEESQCS